MDIFRDQNRCFQNIRQNLLPDPAARAAADERQRVYLRVFPDGIENQRQIKRHAFHYRPDQLPCRAVLPQSQEAGIQPVIVPWRALARNIRQKNGSPAARRRLPGKRIHLFE